LALHIINFAHGAMLTAAMSRLSSRITLRARSLCRGDFPDAYFFVLAMRCSACIGPARMARTATFCWSPASRSDGNALLYAFRRHAHINLSYGFDVVEVGNAF